MSAPFREAADQLLALAGEQLDHAVIQAARELRDVCVEHDEVDARFKIACANLMALLQEHTVERIVRVCPACHKPQGECEMSCPARTAGWWER